MKRLLAWGLIGAGLLLTIGALYFGVFATWAADRRATQAAAVPLVTVEEIATMAEGRRVLVEGEIAEGNPVREYHPDRPGTPQAFVIYRVHRMERRSKPGDDPQVIEHVEEEQVTPPFVLATPGGEVRVVNDDYDYQGNPAHGGWDEEAQRLVNGFPVGASALVDGTVVGEGEHAALRARFVHRGPRDDYLSHLRGDPTSRGMAQFFGLLMGCLGLPPLLLGVLVLWRAPRGTATS